MRADPSPGNRQLLARVLALAAGYFVLARLSLLLAIPPGYATAIWPPAGLALAAVMVGGARLAPGILLGSFLANIPTGFDASAPAALAKSLLLPAAIGLGTSLQAVTGASLLHRAIGPANPLDHERDIGLFLLLGGPVSCVIGASVGVSALLQAGSIEPDACGWSWFTWWVGDSIGVLLVAPWILAWLAEPEAAWKPRRTVLVAPTLAAAALTAAFFVLASRWERTRIVEDMDRRTLALARSLERNLDPGAMDGGDELLRVAAARDGLDAADLTLSLARVDGPSTAAPDEADPFVRTHPVRIGQQVWESRFTPSPALRARLRGWQSWAVLATGLLSAALLGALLLVLTGRASRVQSLVDLRTLEIELANREVERQRVSLAASHERIETSLREKETLLKEIHHRVKNNLQVIVSLLNLQAGSTEEPEVRRQLEASQARIRAIALVHEQLYQSPDLSRVDFATYLRELVEGLGRMSGAVERGIRVRVDAATLRLPVDRAIPLALIVSELVTNGLKHAFPAGRTGSLDVALQEHETQGLILAVQDDGIGMPPEDAPRGLGQELIESLAAQAHIMIERLPRTPGTCFMLSFRRDGDAPSRSPS